MINDLVISVPKSRFDNKSKDPILDYMKTFTKEKRIHVYETRESYDKRKKEEQDLLNKLMNG